MMGTMHLCSIMQVNTAWIRIMASESGPCPACQWSTRIRIMMLNGASSFQNLRQAMLLYWYLSEFVSAADPTFCPETLKKGCWLLIFNKLSNYSGDIMLSADLSSTQELGRDCVCCLTASFSGSGEVVSDAELPVVLELRRGCLCGWTASNAGTQEMLCLLLNCQLCRNSGEVESAAELPVVQELRTGCVCYWTASCAGTQERLCLLLNCQLCRNWREVVSAADLLLPRY